MGTAIALFGLVVCLASIVGGGVYIASRCLLGDPRARAKTVRALIWITPIHFAGWVLFIVGNLLPGAVFVLHCSLGRVADVLLLEVIDHNVGAALRAA